MCFSNKSERQSRICILPDFSSVFAIRIQAGTQLLELGRIDCFVVYLPPVVGRSLRNWDPLHDATKLLPYLFLVIFKAMGYFTVAILHVPFLSDDIGYPPPDRHSASWLAQQIKWGSCFLYYLTLIATYTSALACSFMQRHFTFFHSVWLSFWLAQQNHRWHWTFPVCAKIHNWLSVDYPCTAFCHLLSVANLRSKLFISRPSFALRPCSYVCLSLLNQDRHCVGLLLCSIFVKIPFCWVLLPCPSRVQTFHWNEWKLGDTYMGEAGPTVRIF